MVQAVLKGERWELGCGVAEPHLAGRRARARALVVRGILLPGACQPQTFWGSFQCVCVCVCVCDGEEEVVAGEKDSGKGLWWGALLGTELEEL